MDENEQTRIKKLLVDNHGGLEFVQKEVEDALKWNQIGVEFMIQVLSGDGIQSPKVTNSKGQLKLAGQKLKRVFDNLGPLLELPEEILRWPHPCNLYYGKESEKLFFEQLQPMQNVSLSNPERCLHYGEMKNSLELKLKKRASYLNALILLIEGLKEKKLHDSTPIWFRDEGTLKYNGVTIKKIKRIKNAGNAVAILDEFQDEGWRPISSPITNLDLHQVRKSLNKNLTLITFSVESGKMLWEPLGDAS